MITEITTINAETECNPQHRNERDEGDEMIAPLGARVSEADKKLVGLH